mmetsp:Transcript_22987/g.28194  ORF Transcript_22987/g.28194 Transcript_22987/m.28194 type:complete len:802 (+) Transcript_22987:101-2506(+)
MQSALLSALSCCLQGGREKRKNRSFSSNDHREMSRSSSSSLQELHVDADDKRDKKIISSVILDPVEDSRSRSCQEQQVDADDKKDKNNLSSVILNPVEDRRSRSCSFSSIEIVDKDTDPIFPKSQKEYNEVFKELNIGYNGIMSLDDDGMGWMNKDHDHADPEGIQNGNLLKQDRQGRVKRKYVDMSKPIPAKYLQNKYGGKKGTPVRLGKDINIQTTSKFDISNPSFRSIETEFCGITYRQCSAIMANIERRCIAEGWTRAIFDENGRQTADKFIHLTPKIVNFHDIYKYIITPFTKATGKSLVETLPSTAGEQPSRFFLSHVRTEKFQNVLVCMRELIYDFSRNYNESDDANGGGMTVDTPIWIRAFANNQNDLENAVASDLHESSFARAMEVSNFRTFLILDEDCEVFSSTWCLLELYLSMLLSKKFKKDDEKYDDYNVGGNIHRIWAIYTPFVNGYENSLGKMIKRRAIGIVEGGTPNDNGLSGLTARRVAKFPMERIISALDINIQNNKTSMNDIHDNNDDTLHILNHIVGRTGYADFDLEPLESHENYDKLNCAVKGAIASTTTTLVGALRTGNTEWNAILDAMSKGNFVSVMKFNFKEGCGWDDLTNPVDAAAMVRHLPKSLEKLEIKFSPYGAPLIHGIIDWMKDKHLKTLDIRCTCVGGKHGGRDTGSRLADAIASHESLEDLKLYQTDLIGERNIEDWKKAFKRNQSIKTLDLWGFGDVLGEVSLESTFDEESSTVQAPHLDYSRQRINYSNKTFPDAMLSRKEELQELNQSISTTKVRIYGMLYEPKSDQ